MGNVSTFKKSLQRAINRQELEIVYQPKLNMETEQVTGLEALLRWKMEGGYTVSPDIFIPLAEKSGMITTITFYVAEHVFQCLWEWHMQGIDTVPVSINISRIDLCMPEFAGRLIGLMRQYQIENQAIELEITETFFVMDYEKIVEQLNILRSHGISIAIDDFGTGYSSLSCLRTLPVDIMKIDKVFLTDIVTDEINQGILKGILGIAGALELKVVYEGVETKAQVEYLKQFPYKIAQGFYYAHSMCRSELECWLTSQADFH